MAGILEWTNFEAHCADIEIEDGNPGGGGDCDPFEFSELDQASMDDCFALCEGSELCEADCETLYSAFQFGINSPYILSTQPSWWDTDETWIPPLGAVGLNSSCPSILTEELISDIPWPGPNDIGDIVNYPNITPATIADEMFGAVGGTASDLFMECLATPFAEPGGLPSSTQYEWSLTADYTSEEGEAISGLVMLTDDGSNPTITGYGILLDRTDGTAKFVRWTNDAPDDPTIIDSVIFDPNSAGSFTTIAASAWCDCQKYRPYPHSGIFPTNGLIRAQVGNNTFSFRSIDYAITLDQTDVAELTYCGLISLSVSNGNPRNIIVWSTPSFAHSNVKDYVTNCVGEPF